MIRTLLLKMLALCCLGVLAGMSADAQYWARKYSPDYHMGFYTAYPMNDGSYLCTGNTSFYSNQNILLRIIKVNAAGRVIRQTDHPALGDFVNNASNITQDHGLVVMATGQLDSARNNTTTIVRVDSNGNEQWRRTISHYKHDGSKTLYEVMDLDTTANGGIIFTAVPFDSVTQIYRLCVVRMDAGGQVVWRQTYLDTDTFKYVKAIRCVPGGFLIIASLSGPSSLPGYIFKIDNNGQLLWQVPQLPTYSVDAAIGRDGNILLMKTDVTHRNTVIDKIDQSGTLLWSQSYPGLPDTNRVFSRLIELDDHRLMTIASNTLNTGLASINTMYWLDTLGHIVKHVNLSTAYVPGWHNGLGSPKATHRTKDGGFIMGGRSLIPGSLQPDRPFLIHTDSNGVVYPSVLSGYIYADANGDCVRDTGEASLTTTLATFTSGQDTFTVATDTAGYFAIGLDTVTYHISLQTPSPYLTSSSCNATSIRLNFAQDSAISLGVKTTSISPYISVSGHLGHDIPCQRDIYTAEYCNYGTAPFVGRIQFDVDTLLHIDSASEPWLTQSGAQYTFAVDTLQPQHCRSIELYYTVACDMALLGRTTCIDAVAYQDTIVNPSPLWDHSNLRMSVTYNSTTDSITFTLKNTGTGGMSGPQSLIVIEDNIILTRIPQQLPAGAIFNKAIKANGSTYRATIPQTAYNPYSDYTTAAIEAVGQNAQGGVSLGFLMQYPYNGYTSYHYNTCGELRVSYDPNEKSVSPKGAGTDHLVDTGVALEYTIDFQNTGNDTAYLVTVTDTLPPYVNPATLRFEASSSPCSMEIAGRAVTFTFYPIYLPDSGHNELRSHGFVKFRIDQKAANAQGTVIDNKAHIYFDYNPPVLTNTATVRIGQVYVTGIETLYQPEAIRILAYPNPFDAATMIKVDRAAFGELRLTVYDVSGRKVTELSAKDTDHIMLDRSGLSTGAYTFELYGDGHHVGTGRLVAR